MRPDAARLVIVPFIALLASCASGSSTRGSHADTLCGPLRAFVASVGPHEVRDIAFHTSWGGNFKDSTEKVLAAKRCSHGGYAPAQAVCRELMEDGATEFANENAERALQCLAPGLVFAPGVDLGQGQFVLRHGTPDRGANITLEFGPDAELGGEVLRIKANGY
jgi:hypothetical protein